MTTAETLRALLALVEEAKGPDRRLDYVIFVAFAEPGKSNPWDPKEGHFYTSDADASLALVESQLPAIKAFAAGSPSSSGWKLNFYRGMTPTGAPYALWRANIRQHASDGFEGNGSTLPLAIMAAFLKAKVALLQQSETAHVER